MAFRASLTASTLSPGSKHGFLKTFPRELRDQIYDLLYEEDEIDEEDIELHVLATNPLIALRLISRQFRLEYDERCNKNDFMSQVLFQCIGPYTITHCPDSLAFSSHITNVTVELSACALSNPRDHPCIARHNLTRCGMWMGDLIKQLPRLRWIRVYLTLPYNQCLHGALKSLHHLTGLRKMFEVKVLRPGCKDVESGQYLATWMKERGLEVVDQETTQLSDEETWAG